MKARAILEQVSSLGVELRVVEDRLHVRPRGVLPNDLRLVLRQHHSEVIVALAEHRRSVAADEAWDRLRGAYESASPPVNWLTPAVRFAENVAEQLWRSARANPADDQRFYDALQRWEALATESIASVESPAS